MATEGQTFKKEKGTSLILKEKGDKTTADSRDAPHRKSRTNFYKNVLALLLYAPMHLF